MAGTAALIGANLLPLLGIAFWGWDGFELLVLYWLETAVIAFWALATLRRRPAGSEERAPRRPGAFARTMLFAVQIGLFMTVHMMFLWALFAGGWRDRIHGPAEFVRQLVIENGLWLPLLVLFAVRGVTALGGMFGAAPPGSEKSARRDLYARIITMHITILVGAWLMALIGGRLGLFLVVALKIAIDLFFDPFRGGRAVSAGVPPP